MWKCWNLDVWATPCSHCWPLSWVASSRVAASGESGSGAPPTGQSCAGRRQTRPRWTVSPSAQRPPEDVPEALGGRLPPLLLSQGPSRRDSQLRLPGAARVSPVIAAPGDQVSAPQEGAAWEPAARPRGGPEADPRLPLAWFPAGGGKEVGLSKGSVLRAVHVPRDHPAPQPLGPHAQ